MFPPVKIISGVLEIREFTSQDAPRTAALLAAGDRTALPPQFLAHAADVDRWLTETVPSPVARSTRMRCMPAPLSRHCAACATPTGRHGVSEQRRRRGYATEAARSISRWALTDGGMRRVHLRARFNIASVRVAEKAGYQREGTERVGTEDFAFFSMQIRTVDN